MKVFSSKRRVIALAAFVLLLLFVVRPGASRLKSRIVTSISSAVGRSVEVSSVQLRLLPRPGFVLHDLVVYDDPAFGAEPMLRCGEVSAALRVTSLLRGRLEVARLELTEPSLNLVHAPQGGWNLEALVERSAHRALAPTRKGKSEPRPGFPYIEGTSARINFKNGAEKKPYALTNADFALWQDSENAWGVRLKAQPFRSDFNLNDTGILLVTGTWQRAGLVRDTPLELNLEWSRAQLGQVTKFFSGSDRGWRGAVQLDIALTGTPANLKVTSSASVQDFRRYDIVSGEALKLAARCDGQYSSLDHVFRGLDCIAPVGSGLIRVTGNMGLPGTRTFDLFLTAEGVPASAAATLVQRAKKNLPDDLTVDGVFQGRLSWHADAANSSKSGFEGRGEISDLRLASVSNKAEFGPETVTFIFSAGSKASGSKTTNRSAPGIAMPMEPHLEFGPFPLGAGRAIAARGWVSTSGYDFAVTGEAELGRTLRLARMVGLPALQTNAEGQATVDFRLAGSWSGWSYGSEPGFSGPQLTGSAKLHNVRATFRGTAAPIEIVSGDLHLLADKAFIDKLSVRAASAQWTGSLGLPRECSSLDACQVQFNLNANQGSWESLNNWINPQPAERPWYRMLDSNAQVAFAFPANLHGIGRVSFDRFEMARVTATHLAANLRIEHGKIDASEIRADTLGGTVAGEGHFDFGHKPAQCTENGKLNDVSLIRMTDLLKGRSLTGTASATFELKGGCGADFWPSAEGTVRVHASDAVLPQVSLGEDSASLRLTNLIGEAQLREGKLFIEDATVDSDSGQFQLSGTASLKGDLELKLVRSTSTQGSGFLITGTLAEPRIKPTSRIEQARFKNEPAK